MTLRVTLEIVPFGDENKKYKIGQLDIFNKGPDWETSKHIYGVIDIPVNGKAGMFEQNIKHYRKDGAWRLVEKAIRTLNIEGP